MSQRRPKPSQTLRLPTIIVAAVALGLCVVGLVVLFGDWGTDSDARAAVSTLRLEDIPFNGTRAYEHLKKLCEIGPRPSGSPGMATQQKLMAEHFKRLGGQVEFQQFRVRHPKDESAIVPMANLIVRWHPEIKQRILLCAHYDTLPFPLRDPKDPRGVFVGANDNASGVAVLMELAETMPKLRVKYGVDFVFLDGEEFIFDEGGRFFLGSEYFAREYVKSPPPRPYRWGILLDMVGNKDLQLHQEGNSLLWPDARPVVDSVWATAARLGVKEFIPKKKYYVEDDHVTLHNIGTIPCIDIIDFDYAPWHTQGDLPAECSALSLAKIGWVLQEWLQNAP